MLLSDTAIFEALDEGRLIISPEPGPRIPTIRAGDRPFDRTAVNLRLGRKLRVPRKNMAVVIDLSSGSTVPTLNALYDELEIPEAGHILQPNQFILGTTMEKVTLPLLGDIHPDYQGRGVLAARVEGKSSWARFGLLIHFTAPTIHAGYSGNITLEIMNLGPNPICLRQGMPVCQLLVEQVLGYPQSGDSQFQGQSDPAGPRP